MKGLKFKGKIILPVGLLMLVILSGTLIFTILQFSSFSDELLDERLQAAAGTVRHIVDDTRRITIDAGLDVSMDPRIIQAMYTNDRNIIAPVVRQVVNELPHVTWVTAFNTDGIAHYRTHNPGQYGDALLTPSLLEALEGIISVAYSPSGPIPIPIRSAVPVIYNGEIIGGLTVAHAVGTQHFVESMQARHNADFVVFIEGTSVASTFRGPDGQPMIGTQMLDIAFDRVVNRNQEVFEVIALRGTTYSGFFMPLICPDGSTLGQLFMAISLEAVYTQRNGVILLAAIMGIAGLGIALFLIYLIANRLMSPINHLVEVVSDVSHGNLNFNRKTDLPADEIGALTTDVYGLTDVIKGIADDITAFATEANTNGDIEYRVDASKYRGGYRDMINELNAFTDGFVGDLTTVLGALSNVNEGNFKAEMKKLPGKKAILNTSVDNLMANLNAVNAEVGEMITAAAVKGDLHFVIDDSKYQGDWQKLMQGLNQIAEAVDAPIIEIRDIMNKMANGEFLGVSVAGNYKGDFLEIKNAVNGMINNLNGYMQEAVNALDAISGGDLTKTISREFIGNFSLLKTPINNIASSLNRTMTEIFTASEQVLSGAKQISSSAADLANGAQQQASSVQELNASIDIISQQTQQNAASANDASALSRRSTENANAGSETMKQMLGAMDAIKTSSNEISQIIKAIQDITFQTNLLSLNASVEAARAGEHGRGFAVVADEVRNLATKSQQSTVQSTALIGESIERVEAGSSIAQTTSESLAIIVKNAAEIMEIINNISASSQEQAESIAQVSQGLAQISSVVQSNSAVSEETAAASQELNSQAEVLKQLVSYFKL